MKNPSRDVVMWECHFMKGRVLCQEGRGRKVPQPIQCSGVSGEGPGVPFCRKEMRITNARGCRGYVCLGYLKIRRVQRSGISETPCPALNRAENQRSLNAAIRCTPN